jgi:four helix bundle protein
MNQNPMTKTFDLEERTFEFALADCLFVKKVPHTHANVEDARQLIRASGSVGANYIEANESLGKKDFLMRAQIARKEAKEARYWLRLLDTGNDPAVEKQRAELMQEATELLKILSSILLKST